MVAPFYIFFYLSLATSVQSWYLYLTMNIHFTCRPHNPPLHPPFPPSSLKMLGKGKVIRKRKCFSVLIVLRSASFASECGPQNMCPGSVDNMNALSVCGFTCRLTGA